MVRMKNFDKRMLVYMYVKKFIGKNTVKIDELEEMMHEDGIFDMTDEEFKKWALENNPEKPINWEDYE